MIREVVFINGVYDITCSLCILKIIHNEFFGTLHTSMMKPSLQENRLYVRLLGYFILLYGFVRLYGEPSLVSISYIIETLYYSQELYNDTVYTNKSLFVIATSAFMSIVVMYT